MSPGSVAGSPASELVLILNMSMRVFLEKPSAPMGRLGKAGWVGVTRSVEGLNRTKRWREREFYPRSAL